MLQDDINRILGHGPVFPKPRELWNPEPEPDIRCDLLDHLAAIHECAHCAYAYFTGAPVHDVAINGQGLGGGEFRHTDLPPIELVTDDDDPKARARQDIQIVTAINRDTEEVWVRGLIGLKTGKVAQHAFGARGEFYDAVCQHDDEIISRVLGLMSKSPEHRRRLYCRIEVEAELFVKKYWSAILRLAEELLRKKHLDKDQIAATLAPPAHAPR